MARLPTTPHLTGPLGSRSPRSGRPPERALLGNPHEQERGYGEDLLSVLVRTATAVGLRFRDGQERDRYQ
jgi:hypothetical protein